MAEETPSACRSFKTEFGGRRHVAADMLNFSSMMASIKPGPFARVCVPHRILRDSPRIVWIWHSKSVSAISLALSRHPCGAQ